MLSWKWLFTVALAVFICTAAAEDDDDEDEKAYDPAHGLPKDIDWVRWDDALDKAEKEKKPVFLLVHKSWCHACTSLKKKFEQKSAQKELQQYAKYFIMVSAADDEEPWEEEYAPDGKYIPRLIFIKSDGDIMPKIVNPKPEYSKFKYYFSTPGEVMDAMRTALTELGIDHPAKKAVKLDADEQKGKGEGKPPAAEPPADAKAPADKKKASPKSPKKPDEL